VTARPVHFACGLNNTTDTIGDQSDVSRTYGTNKLRLFV
jgi:hypothetical protein